MVRQHVGRRYNSRSSVVGDVSLSPNAVYPCWLVGQSVGWLVSLSGWSVGSLDVRLTFQTTAFDFVHIRPC